MTTTVTMLQTRQGEGGSLWTVGNSYAASDAFATVLINSNYATGTLPKSRGLVPVNAQTDSNGQITALVDGDGIAIPPTNVSVNSRDGMGRATSYTVAGTIFTVTYGANGVSTVSGGGKITTFTYNASGLLTSVATA